jgi:beta-glucosidase
MSDGSQAPARWNAGDRTTTFLREHGGFRVLHHGHPIGSVPLLVTENGIGTEDDEQRVQYVTEALHRVRRCLDDGLDVRGYFYWSLLDNFEWALGYRPTFGIVAVDRHTQERTVKPSARWLGEIARTNRLDA